MISSIKTVGFIGTGLMGLPMAKNILFSTKSGTSKTTNLFFLYLVRKRSNFFLTVG